jgi:hypothetical protein
VPDSLSEREPKSAMIASPDADDRKPLHVQFDDYLQNGAHPSSGPVRVSSSEIAIRHGSYPGGHRELAVWTIGHCSWRRPAFRYALIPRHGRTASDAACAGLEGPRQTGNREGFRL